MGCRLHDSPFPSSRLQLRGQYSRLHYIIVLQCWNTAVLKHPSERENDPHCKKAEDHLSTASYLFRRYFHRLIRYRIQQHTTWNTQCIAVRHTRRLWTVQKQIKRSFSSLTMCGSPTAVGQFAATYGMRTLGQSRRRKSNSSQEAAGRNFFMVTAATLSLKKAMKV